MNNNNTEFEKAIISLFTQKVRETIKPVEEGSEMAEMGYKREDGSTFTATFEMKKVE